MPIKQVSQLVTDEGKAAAPATSAPGWFIQNGTAVQEFEDRAWGNTFAPPRSGNKIQWFVTGEEYYNYVAKKFLEAKQSIYITGWQVNFDVELAGGETLFEILGKALAKNPNLYIYVMPWMSPKVQVDCNDFETMLAIFQLNSGLKGPARAFALPAVSQTDIKAGLGATFSHHQKLVVIDRMEAFVGGIDLAYGRRDNADFSLAAGDRKGNELYNPCVPHIEEMSEFSKRKYLTRGELFFSCFSGPFAYAGTFATSASGAVFALKNDATKFVTDNIKDGQQHVSNAWQSINLTPKYVAEWRRVLIDKAEKLAREEYRKLDKELDGKLEFLRKNATASAADASAALVSWLDSASMESLPAELYSGTSVLIESLMLMCMSVLHHTADKKINQYDSLIKLRKMLPKGGKTIAESQPRMPWHDVHSSVSGPAVSDFCHNFELRWNGVAQRYEKSLETLANDKNLKAIFEAVSIKPTGTFQAPRLILAAAAEKYPKPAKSWTQVLRSAPQRMQLDEANAMRQKPSGPAQDNCLKATINAIMGAQHFIYIEGQFFQTAYGEDTPAKDAPVSGPMAALIDITASPKYRKYMKILGLEGVAPQDIPSRIKWSGFLETLGDADFEDFKRDLKLVLANIAAIKVTKALGEEQPGLLNPVGDALAKSVESAIRDNRPFHIYMVLPVHPEGMLNALPTMTQLHLTMQSLVFGSDSLVNRIRRAVLAGALAAKEKIGMSRALEIVATYPLEQVEATATTEWTYYLTLLNLRNWEVIDKRPVTEQIYVHSKLLIADDRVAILGSANLNDRSLLGGRDSELAMIVRDDAQIPVKLNGVDVQPVSANVHQLRVRLWKKLFGLMGGARPASELASMIVKPAAPATWNAIQKVAMTNAQAYHKAFPFLAAVTGKPSSIWPAWNNKSKRMDFYMPFNDRFWRDDEVRDELFTWDAKGRAPESEPIGVKGFIVALPITWTFNENNRSGMNLTLLADNGKPSESGTRHAAVEAGNKGVAVVDGDAPIIG